MKPSTPSPLRHPQISPRGKVWDAALAGVARAWLFVGLLIALTPSVALAEAAESSPAKKEDADAPPQQLGFELGTFRVKNFRPVEGAKTTLTFTLHASVREDRAERFQQLLKNRTNRLRDQVIVASRLAEAREFQDPELKRFRRRLLARFHRSAPELPIDEVYFSDFRYMVQ